MIYLISGWPGAGKSTVAVQHAIYRYAAQGRRIATNFPIDFGPVCIREDSKLSKATVHVLPDRPTRRDLDRLGVGGESEEKAGMLVVDEAGGWLNARQWNGSEREFIIDWLTQSRKRYWDIYLIAQAPAMLDKQVREAVCEAVVRIRRFDRFRILGVKLPRVHVAIVKYGLDQSAPVIERWFYRGTEAHKCFGSYRLFGASDAHYTVLPATKTKWARMVRRVPNELHKLFVRGALAIGILGCLLSYKLGLVMLGLIAGLGWLVGFDVVKPRRLYRIERLAKRRLDRPLFEVAAEHESGSLAPRPRLAVVNL